MIKPRYQDEQTILYCSDCLEILPTLESESVNVVITDPPYNIGKKYDTVSDKRDDYQKWCSYWVKECFRIIGINGIISLKNTVKNLPIMFFELEKYGELVNQIIWRNVSANHSKRMFWSAYESILIYSKSSSYVFNTYAETREVSKPSWSKKRRMRQKNQLLDIWDDIKNVYSGSVNHPEVIHAGDGTNRKAHPCQQPIALPRRLILFFTNPGDIVLDPFMGTGTTGVACIQTGRRFIGIEIADKYYQIAEQRIKRAKIST